MSEDTFSETNRSSVMLKTFSFPFKPYPIQVDFMHSLYEALELGKIGIFESPTGTGKSLSLICGSLTWLRDQEKKQERELEELEKVTNMGSCSNKTNVDYTIEPDWLRDYDVIHGQSEKLRQLKEIQERKMRRQKKLKQLKEAGSYVKYKKKSVYDSTFDELFKDAPNNVKNAGFDNDDIAGVIDDDDSDVLVADYQSDEENQCRDDSDQEDDDDIEEEHVLKIYYCSRTHSQLAQFVREIQKSPFGSDTAVVALGSRQNLCINENVKRLKSISLMNDRCLELQKNKRSTKKNEDGIITKKRRSRGVTCPFYLHTPLQQFKEMVQVEVRDIEQLTSMGKTMKACPYYGTRYAIPDAQVVVLPYNTLLHRATREACGIKLSGNIVIVDEAHNLLETINNIHSVEVTAAQFICAHSQLAQYLDKYGKRLLAKNLLYIKQILMILSNCITFLNDNKGDSITHGKMVGDVGTRLMTLNEFLFEANIDNINLFKLLKYCKKSRISKKLNGFIEKYSPSVNTQNDKNEMETNASSVSKFLQNLSGKNQIDKKSEAEQTKENSNVRLSSPLMHIEGFFEALTNSDKDGRIVVNRQGIHSKSLLKFLLLNPAVHFADIVSECRAVIVAGGTMQPTSEFKDQLFAATGVTSERIAEFSCGHVIPSSQLLPISLTKGPSGIEFDFTYKSRGTPKVMEELGRLLVNVSNIIPGGMVVFFPSYEYEKQVMLHWQLTNQLVRIGSRKQIFREPKKASQVEQVIQEYSVCVKSSLQFGNTKTGAILFCVVGGKMSEGINFSDELGRCIVMIGLPYPNLHSPELKEKMDYLNKHVAKGPGGSQPGQIYYENLCLKAVNQSIGRAIRHKDDYATILLLDHRYGRNSIISKLPEWISQYLKVYSEFGIAFTEIRKVLENG